MRKTHPILSWFLSALLAFAVPALDGCNKLEKKQPTSRDSESQAPVATYAKPSADELYRLVAPIALFPDNLVAQVLAGSTYPDQIATAAGWLKQNVALKGADLMQAVNQESWDVSVKGLTQFPDVLNQMASNLSWTSALGDAYFNVPEDVMNSIQVMRQRASQAGNLKSNTQQKVTTEPDTAARQQVSSDQQPTVVQAPPQTIIIEPAQPQVVYVPSYNPAVVYGAPIPVYPGYVAPPPPSTGELVATGLISFGLGMAVGAAMNNNCCGWGWNSWGCGWHSSTVVYNRNTYISTSNTFVNRSNYYNRNVNNVNRNNFSSTNINRNNLNVNTNRSNINNNYRANNFSNTARSSTFTSPNFGTQRDQAQYRNVNESLGQRSGATNRTNYGSQNRQPVAQAANRQSLGQTQNRQQLGQASSRPQTAQAESRPNFNQAQRGYGQQAGGLKSGTFSNYSPGGNARVNSARGQQSMSGTRSSQSRQSGSRTGRRR